MTPITEKSIGLDGEVFEDRRGETRQRVLKGGKLSFNKGYGALECVVRNVSPHGARLAFGDTAAVPPAFTLFISGEDAPHRAQLRWRGRDAVGVSFED